MKAMVIKQENQLCMFYGKQQIDWILMLKKKIKTKINRKLKYENI